MELHRSPRPGLQFICKISCRILRGTCSPLFGWCTCLVTCRCRHNTILLPLSTTCERTHQQGKCSPFLAQRIHSCASTLAHRRALSLLPHLDCGSDVQAPSPATPLKCLTSTTIDATACDNSRSGIRLSPSSWGQLVNANNIEM